MSQSAQDILFREMGLVFEPLGSLDSVNRVNTLFNELGYELPGGNNFPNFPGLVTHIESLINLLIKFDRAADSAKIQVLAELTQEILKLTEEIVALEQAVRTSLAAVPAFLSNAPLNELPSRVLDYLIIEYTKRHRLPAYAVMNILGIFETVELPANAAIFQPQTQLRKIFWERLGTLVSDPVGLWNEVYNWETAFDSQKFFTRVDAVLKAFLLPGGLYDQSPTLQSALGNTTEKLKELRFPILQNSVYPSLHSQFGINVTPVEAQGSRKAGFALVPYVYGAAQFDFNLNSKFQLVFETTASVDAGFGFIIRPNGVEWLTNLFDAPLDSLNLDAQLKFQQRANTGEIILFGAPNATRLAIEGPVIKLYGGTQGREKDIGFEVKLDAIRLIVAGGTGDGFLQKMLGDGGIKAEAGFTVGYSAKKGLHFEGSGGLELKLDTHITLGPLEIQGIVIALKLREGNFVTEGGANLKISLGPMAAVVENIGMAVTLSFPDKGGNLGPANLAPSFKPPNGLGLSINAGAVIGGGYLFFDYEKEEYAGALELTIAGFISAKAIGLITTKMPDGSKGFSMLIIITAEFNPPFQLGYGFTLIGVGGLLGLNRTVLLDPLREGVRTGAVNNIMFPQNVVANAPRIISDLKTIFPAYEGKFLIGPMGKLGWGTPTLISLSLGLIIEIPGNIAILGVLKIVLPEERLPLVKIQVAFVGTLDFNKKMLTFDASLFESSVLIMTLEGDMAVRLKWGDNPDFLLSVGGFHPSYTPPPLSLPTMRRLAINILNTSVAKIRVECYMAVTSNTVQFGAKAELFFGFSAISIEGHIAFDALFQFSPFYFIIQISASVSLKVFGMGLFSIRLRFSLEGPTPWRAKGTGSISFFFFDVSADFDTTWGEAKNTAMPETDILPRFLEEINKREQWSTALSTGKNLLVSLRRFTDESAQPLVLHPAGSLVIQQKLVPLTVTIDRVGNKKTADVQKIAISSVSSNGINLHQAHVNEDFARSQYQKLTDAEKLSKPSFEKMPGGVQVSMSGNSIQNGKMVRRNIAYEITIVDKQPKKPLPLGMFFGQIGILFTHFLKGNSASKSVLSKAHAEKRQPFAEKVEVRAEGYSVAFKTNNQVFESTATFASEMSAQSYLRDEIGKNPNLQKELHIIPNYELQEP